MLTFLIPSTPHLVYLIFSWAFLEAICFTMKEDTSHYSYLVTLCVLLSIDAMHEAHLTQTDFTDVLDLGPSLAFLDSSFFNLSQWSAVINVQSFLGTDHCMTVFFIFVFIHFFSQNTRLRCEDCDHVILLQCRNSGKDCPFTAYLEVFA